MAVLSYIISLHFFSLTILFFCFYHTSGNMVEKLQKTFSPQHANQDHFFFWDTFTLWLILKNVRYNRLHLQQTNIQMVIHGQMSPTSKTFFIDNKLSAHSRISHDLVVWKNAFSSVRIYTVRSENKNSCRDIIIISTILVALNAWDPAHVLHCSLDFCATLLFDSIISLQDRSHWAVGTHFWAMYATAKSSVWANPKGWRHSSLHRFHPKKAKT